KVASPAVDSTSAVVDAVYVLATPGTKAPNDIGPPSESDSVAGTSPETPPLAGTPIGRTSDVLSTQTVPPRPVTPGAFVRFGVAVAATLTAIAIGGYAAPGASTSLRVQVIVAVPAHVHPGPDAPVAVSPLGIASVTVVVLPSVGVSMVGFAT